MYFNIHKEKRCHKSGFFSFSPRVNRRRTFRWQTYHMRDINAELNVSFHWFHIFAIILKSWDDVKPTSLFISVCVVVLQMSTVIFCEKVPQQCTAWIWCIMCPIHCELTGKKDQPINLDFFFFDYVGIFSDVDVLLLFHVILVVIEAQHAFHQRSHCVNYKHEETLHFRRWGLSLCKYGILMCKSDELRSRRVYLYEAVKGPRLGFKGDVHNVYMISTLFWDLQSRSGCIYITS